MSESDSIKANIAFHEKMFFAAIAILVALIGWMLQIIQLLAVYCWFLH